MMGNSSGKIFLPYFLIGSFLSKRALAILDRKGGRIGSVGGRREGRRRGSSGTNPCYALLPAIPGVDKKMPEKEFILKLIRKAPYFLTGARAGSSGQRKHQGGSGRNLDQLKCC